MFQRRVGKVRYGTYSICLRVTVLVTYLSFVQFGCSGWYVQDGTFIISKSALLGCLKPKVYSVIIHICIRKQFKVISISCSSINSSEKAFLFSISVGLSALLCLPFHALPCPCCVMPCFAIPFHHHQYLKSIHYSALLSIPKHQRCITTQQRSVEGVRPSKHNRARAHQEQPVVPVRTTSHDVYSHLS